ncbi:MAG: cytochrome c oxidase subunit 3 [Pseudomonadota bacterium]
MSTTTNYYVPDQSPWPFATAACLFVTAWGAASTIQQHSGVVSNDGTLGTYILIAGLVGILSCMFLWFRDTVRESIGGLNSHQMDISYRMGMAWFIFSEVMFFCAFFFALFYTRWFAVPWLGGEGAKGIAQEILWPNFQAMWPLVSMPDGRTVQAMQPWGLPAINTALLLTSGIFLTIAHHAIKTMNRPKILLNLGITILLGSIFMCVQAYEYYHAYHEMGLTLNAGIYGSTFFMLTGFHGLHVTIGTIILMVLWLRVAKGHFTADNHFAFEAGAWYWHFVDVVWIFLFIVVYWL